MQRHALPQNIMDVEFKLFGAFTLKQFINLAVNVVIALIIYTFKIPSVVKWPIIVFFVLLGLALAMVTVNGQPFSTWLGNFLLALTTSQRRVWKKSPKRPDILRGSYKPTSKYTTHTVSRSEKKLKFDMPLLKDEVLQVNDQLDKSEDKDLSTIDMHMQNNFSKEEFEKRVAEKEVQLPAGVSPNPAPPLIEQGTQGLAMSTDLNDPSLIGVPTGDNLIATIKVNQNDQRISKGRINTRDNKINLKTIDEEIAKREQQTIHEEAPTVSQLTNQPSEAVFPIQETLEEKPEPLIEKVEEEPVAKIKPITEKIESIEPEQVNPPSDSQIESLEKQIEALQKQVSSMKQPQHLQPPVVEPPVEEEPVVPVKQPIIIEEKEENFEAPTLKPKKVNRPNIISGFVIDPAGIELAGVSVEIKDAAGFPLRKTVTGEGGYFIFTTPLPNGKYVLDFEKKGRKFIDYNINLNGKILPTYKFREVKE